MKTSRIPTIQSKPYCFHHAKCLIAFGIALLSCQATSLANPLTANPLQAPAKQNATPDPYFGTKSFKSSSTYSVEPPATRGWEAPLTPVEQNQTRVASLSNSIASTPFQPSNSALAPLTSTPGTRAATTAPSENSFAPRSPLNTTSQFGSSNPGSNSIIRQPSTGFTAENVDNSFAIKSNSFGGNIPGANDSESSIKVHSNELIVNDKLVSGAPSNSFNSFGGGFASNQTSNGPSVGIQSQKSNWSAQPASATTPSNASEILSATAAPAFDPRETFEPGQVLALVGGEPILVGDVLFEVNQLLEKFMAAAPPEVKARERKKAIPKMLPQFVQTKLMYLGTLRQLPDGVDVENVLEQAAKEFDENALTKMMKASGIKSVAEFDAHLRAQGSSLRKLRRSWSQDQLTRFFLAKQIKFNEDVTHQEMLDDYRENLASYATPAKCRWEQIMIRYDKSDSPQAARAAIIELGDQLVYGANLGAVAKKSSHGYLAYEGGQHDWTTKGSLVLKNLDEALFTIPVGKLSEIIETNDGFHIIRILERTEATHTPFLEAQVEIKKRIFAERREAAFKAYIEKLEDEIPVEYFIGSTMDSLQAVR